MRDAGYRSAWNVGTKDDFVGLALGCNRERLRDALLWAEDGSFCSEDTGLYVGPTRDWSGAVELAISPRLVGVPRVSLFLTLRDWYQLRARLDQAFEDADDLLGQCAGHDAEVKEWAVEREDLLKQLAEAKGEGTGAPAT